ncbi:MAG: pentapeptide repeat-containing protein [Myxococcota bacterium]
MPVRVAGLLVVAVVGSMVAQGAGAASYQKIDGTIVDPILDRLGATHPYAGPDLSPGVSAPNTSLRNADLAQADLAGADFYHAILEDADLTGADLSGADLAGVDLRSTVLVNTILENAHYNLQTEFPSGFNPISAGMVSARVINNGLAPPNLANVVDKSDSDFIVNNEGCNALIAYPCSTPGAPTTVSGTAQQVRVYESSSFAGFADTLTAADQAHAEVTLDGTSAGVSAYGQSTVTAHGLGGNPDCVGAQASDDAHLVVTGSCWNGVGASGRSRVVYAGYGADGSDIGVRGDAFLDVFGFAYDVWVEERGTAILHPGSEMLLGIRVSPDATLFVEGGFHFERAGTFEVRGKLRMTGGSTGETGIRVLGYGEIAGGSFDAAPESYYEAPYGIVPGPWNFLSEQSGLIDLTGATLGSLVSLGARDSSRIRIYGSDFVVAGQPVASGSIPTTDGTLSGTLANGDPINNPFAHRGADCGGQPCTGRILVLAPGLDWDQDAVPNPFDNCAEEPNADQADLDSDGTGDVCFAPVDLDHDGIVDALDNCRVDANPDQIDSDADGVGDACEKNLIFWADKGLEGCTTPPQRLPYDLVSNDLGNGDVIDRSAQPCDCFGIEYPVTPGTASVRFLHRSESGFVEEYCENVAPYALGLGPNQPICADGLDEDGLHEVMATPYDAPGCEAGGGNALPSSIRSFTMAAPEPGLGVMVGLGCLGLACISRNGSRAVSPCRTED